MKKTINPGRNLFAILFVTGLFSVAGFAQSTNPDTPTVLKQNTIEWKRKAPGKTIVHYYTFEAGPGTVEITTDQKSVGDTGNENLSWEFTDRKMNNLAFEMLFGVGTSERKVSEATVDKKQKVLLKIIITEDVQEFRIRFDGAVTFEKGDEDIPEITGSNDTPSTQQICMPRNGVIIMTMQDGKKAKVDLSKVQKIEIQ